MNERTTMDSLLESMLEDRAAGPAPSDLRREVVAVAMAEVPAGPRRSRLARVRTSGSPLRLLAIAAVLGTAAAGALVAGGALRDERTPPDPATVVVPVTSPGPEEGDAPGAPTLIRCTSLPADGYVERETLPIPTYPFAEVSSDIVTGGGPFLVVTPMESLGGAPRSIPLPAMEVRGLGVSPDGRLITIDTVGRYGGRCGHPVLVSVIDGSLLRPFDVGGAEYVSLPTWAPDGRTLYAIHRTLATGPLVPVEDRGSVWAWDRTANTVANLGAPCDGCGVHGVVARPGGGGLAVAYTETGCDPDAPDCSSGIAVRVETGWRIVATPAQLAESIGAGGGGLEPLGVASDGTFTTNVRNGAIALVPLEAAGVPELIGGPCCYGLELASLSPDGSTIAGVVTSEDGLDRNVVLLDLAARAWSTPGTIDHRPDEQADSDQVLASAWAPDGGSIAFLMASADGGTATVRIVRADDGSIVDVPIERSDVITWVPATP